MSQSALWLALADIALRHEQCGIDESSMRLEPESGTTIGILAIIHEPIAVQGDVASCIEEMSGHGFKAACRIGLLHCLVLAVVCGTQWPITPSRNDQCRHFLHQRLYYRNHTALIGKPSWLRSDRNLLASLK
jgi:hypothetical protein